MQDTLLKKMINKTDIFSRFVALNYLPRWFVLFLDIILTAISFTISILLVHNFSINDNVSIQLPIFLRFGILMSVQIVAFWLFHTYSGILRFSSFADAMKLFFSIVTASLIVAILNFISIHLFNYPLFFYLTIFFYSFITFSSLFLLRLGAKTVFEFIGINIGYSIPVMIYGAKEQGVAIAKMLRTSKEKKYRLVGFLETDETLRKKVLMGVKVFSLNKENIYEFISKKAKAIIITPNKLDEINKEKDLEPFLNYGLKMLFVPHLDDWSDNKLSKTANIQDIKIEDLLHRSPIRFSTENINKTLNNKVIMITGACGSIGSEIARQCVKFKPKLLVFLDNAETPMHELSLRMQEEYPELNFVQFIGDVRNLKRMELAMSTFMPDIVFHAAAYKHVPLMENNPTESIQVNVLGTKNMADLSVKYNVKRFVMVSTDKAVNPTNIMGASKRISEIYVQSLNQKINADKKESTKFITTRFGNVLGSNGSVIPHFKRQIKKGGPVTVTHPDIIRYFMTIPEACLLVLEAGTSGKGGEIFIFDMGEPVKIADLAKRMIRLAGFQPGIDIKIEYTGLREGEKLYEELLNQKEITTKTHHQKIMIAKVREYDYDEVSKKIEELITNSYYGKNFLTVRQMKKIVPEFKSNNSIYEKLDIHIDNQ